MESAVMDESGVENLANVDVMMQVLLPQDGNDL
jgi:hypothetical protein